jgi:hypothetical protein
MDYYMDAFYSVVKDTQEHTGLTLPHHLEAYVVMLLASKVDQPDFLPTGTFAQSYMEYSQNTERSMALIKNTTKTLGLAVMQQRLII